MGRLSFWLRKAAAATLLALTPCAEGQQMLEDIEYESPGSSRNHLDIILPAGGPQSGKPTILYIHGGAWYAYDKTADRPIYFELANRGYATVACNYELSTPTTPSFPQAVQDVKNVIRWIKTVGAQYDLSPVVFVVGPSAGGHLGVMAATTAGDSRYESLAPPLGGYRPAAFIQIAGFSNLEWQVLNHGQHWMFTQFLGATYLENPQVYREASPLFYADACDPPGAFLHGTADTVAPHQHSEMMHEALQSSGVFTHLLLVSGATHSFTPFGGFAGIAEHIDALATLLTPHTFTPDLSGDGALNVLDFNVMLQLYANGDPRADINGDGALNIIDFTAYLQAFAGGC